MQVKHLVSVVVGLIKKRTPAMTPRAFSRRAVILTGIIIALGILGGLGGCSEVRAAMIDTWTGPGRFPVGVMTTQVVDRTRSTPSNPFACQTCCPGSPSRLLNTDVYYPAASGTPGVVVPGAPLDTHDGRFPLLVFAHGFAGSKTGFVDTLVHLASHGYVVVAPDFPLTNTATVVGGCGYRSDLVNQPGDVSFEIDTFTGIGDSPGGPFVGVVDGSAVGMVGHSLGGDTALLAGFGGPLADPRLKAAAAAAPGPGSCFSSPMFASTRTLPFVILHGTSDEFVNPAKSRELYPLMLPPKFLVEIVGGDHVGFESGLGNLRDPVAIGLLVALPVPGSLPAQTADLDAALLAKVPGADLTPCASPPMLPNPNVTLDPLIPKAEQVRITNGALTAFFDAFLRHDRGARRFFLGLSRRTAFGREVRSCKSPRRSRPCHLPPLPSPPSGAFVDAWTTPPRTGDSGRN
jgi:predicted dienelactone hydrolase